jgi:hypothetical protein
MVIAQRDFAVVRDAWKIRTNSFASTNKFSSLALFTILAATLPGWRSTAS